MHRPRERNHTRGRHGSTSYAARGNFRHGVRKPEKKLDPNLFIKKTKGVNTQAEYIYQRCDLQTIRL